MNLDATHCAICRQKLTVATRKAIARGEDACPVCGVVFAACNACELARPKKVDALRAHQSRHLRECQQLEREQGVFVEVLP